MSQFAIDLLIVLALVFLICCGLVVWRIGPSNLPAYLRTNDGKGVARGVILAPAVIIAIALLMYLLPGKARADAPLNLEIPGTWFADAGVFMGLDRTKGVSPQCVAGGYDDRSTSNMGVRLNVWESPSRLVRVNAKYTHHSCALNPDRNGYDGVGIEVEWRIWNRYR